MKTTFADNWLKHFLIGGAALFSYLHLNAAPEYTFTTLAGSVGVPGSTNATGSAASFDSPQGMAIDASGNLYIADSANNLIRKVTSGGVVTTFAGTGLPGSTDATGTAASFNSPGGITIDNAGNLYVADSANHIIREITPGGVVTTLAGMVGVPGSTDATGTAAQFNYPIGVAMDNTGNILVADTSNQTIRSITPAGVVSTIAGLALTPGSTNATGTAARFTHPFGLVVDGSGNIFVADNGNHLIRKIAPGGVVTTLAGTAGVSGSIDATGTAAKFNAPFGLTLDGYGNIYVADFNNDTIRRVTQAGVVTTLAGAAHVSGSTDATGPNARFFNPAAIVFDASGNLCVTDSDNDTVRKGQPFFGQDLNNDGKTDILWQNTTTGDRAIWLMNGTTVSAQAYLAAVSTNWQIAGTGDFNGDGQTDILWQNTVTGDRTVWLMNGATIASQVYIAFIPTDWQIVGTGDFNGDGQTDILWQNAVTGDRTFWLMNGTTIAAQIYLAFIPTDWQIAGVGDFNGDGKPDIVWQNTTTGDRTIWLMNGTAIAAQIYLANIPNYWQIASIDDYNGDGKPDILWQNTITGDRAFWLMDGTTLIAQSYLANIPDYWQIAP